MKQSMGKRIKQFLKNSLLEMAFYLLVVAFVINVFIPIANASFLCICICFIFFAMQIRKLQEGINVLIKYFIMKEEDELG